MNKIRLDSLFDAFLRSTKVGLLIFLFVFIPAQYFFAKKQSYNEAKNFSQISIQMVALALESAQSVSEVNKTLSEVAANKSVSSVFLVSSADREIYFNSILQQVSEDFKQALFRQMDFRQFKNSAPVNESFFFDWENSVVSVAPVSIDKLGDARFPVGKYFLVIKNRVNFKESLVLDYSVYYFFVIFFSISGLLVAQYLSLRKNFVHPLGLVIEAIKSWPSEAGRSLSHMMGRGEIVFLKDSFLNLMTTKKINEERLAQERAKAVHNSKLDLLGEISASVAHEINNPLSILTFNLEVLDSYKEQPAKFQSKIESSKKALERISKIVNGLKRFSRNPDGDAKKVVQLSLIVHEVTQLLEIKIKKSFFQISVQVPDDLKIFCDPFEIEQVLINLINNAMDANTSNTAKWIRIVGFADQHNVILHVIDSGPGIPDKIREKLFQPFFTTKPVDQGPGIGLSITKDILDKHGATIELKNSSFQNTCFEIKFPKKDETSYF